MGASRRATCGALFTLGILVGDDTINRAGERHLLVPQWFTVTPAVVGGALLVGLAMMPLGNAGFVAVMLGFFWFTAASVVLAWRVDDQEPEPRVS